MKALKQQLAFIQELDKLKAVQRKALIKCDANRYENSAEHSWHIAMTASVLQEYAAEAINIHRVSCMLLIHDIVEIDAGDTFAFAQPHELDGMEEKELAAANRLFGLLPQDQYQEFKQLWLEFEQAKTPDARFAKAMDRILPLVQNMQNQGGSWAVHGIAKSQIIERNKYLKGLAPKLWDYASEQIELAVSNGWLQDK